MAEKTLEQRIRALHFPFGIYDECDHEHTEAHLEAGDCLEIMEVGLTCEDGLMYRICESCCTDGGGQTEQCISSHEHGKDEPICATMALLENREPVNQ